MFLIRALFWLSVVVLLLPGDPERGVAAPRVGAIDALLAARSTIADLSQFCERNPAVCITGGAVVGWAVEKVRYNAGKLYDYLSDDPAPLAVEPRAAGAAPGTLTAEDAATPWRGPPGTGGAV